MLFLILPYDLLDISNPIFFPITILALLIPQRRY
jgi:hypothetical protein